MEASQNKQPGSLHFFNFLSLKSIEFNWDSSNKCFVMKSFAFEALGIESSECLPSAWGPLWEPRRQAQRLALGRWWSATAWRPADVEWAAPSGLEKWSRSRPRPLSVAHQSLGSHPQSELKVKVFELKQDQAILINTIQRYLKEPKACCKLKRRRVEAWHDGARAL